MSMQNKQNHSNKVLDKIIANATELPYDYQERIRDIVDAMAYTKSVKEKTEKFTQPLV